MSAATATHIDVNRRNAQLSTGPKTDEGKARSSQNSRKHGYNSAKLVIPEHLRQEFEDYHDGLRATIKPVDSLADDLFRQLLHAGWNMQRIEVRQLELFSDAAALSDDKRQTELQLLNRYHANFHRIYQRTLRTLREHQTNVLSLRLAFPAERGAGLSALCRPVSLHQALREAIRLYPETFHRIVKENEEPSSPSRDPESTSV